MGHLVGKDIYRKLGKKIDGLTMRAPYNETLYKILRELYTPEEAELIVKMPYSPSSFEKIQLITRYETTKLQKLLFDLAEKGLLLDFVIRGNQYYIISPMVIGIFEFTMMRTRGELNYKEWARLFNDYMHGDDSFFRANFGKGTISSPLRAIPYEETIDDEEYVEILDYEKASSIIDMHDKFAIGLCSCRHEKKHLGQNECEIPVEKCSTFGGSVDYMVSHGFAREVSRSEMVENLAQSKEMNLVLCADNVRKNVSFICHCCGCCCNVLLGISQLGFPSTVVTSSYIARVDPDECLECGNCAEVCPIQAITSSNGDSPVIDETSCLGCGVCALNCSSESLKLVKRDQKVIHPEDTFEKLMMQCLERGTLQNQMFPEPEKLSHKFLRGFIGGFLKLPPVKKALLGENLRSRFFTYMRSKS
jgi:Pyruvate/2-oxoacid:ferredoxin oxidoreductase delta subunit